MTIMSKVLNDENLLDFALHYLSDKNSDDYQHPIAYEIVVSYVMQEFDTKGIEHNDAMINTRMGELLLEHTLKGLVEKEYVEPVFHEDGRITYIMGKNG